MWAVKKKIQLLLDETLLGKQLEFFSRSFFFSDCEKKIINRISSSFFSFLTFGGKLPIYLVPCCFLLDGVDISKIEISFFFGLGHGWINLKITFWTVFFFFFSILSLGWAYVIGAWLKKWKIDFHENCAFNMSIDSFHIPTYKDDCLFFVAGISFYLPLQIVKFVMYNC